MMIRLIAGGTLALLLVLVLYLPSVHPPERFVGHLHDEYVDLAATWRPEAAFDSLRRALKWRRLLPRQSGALLVQANADAIEQVLDSARRGFATSRYAQALGDLVLMAGFRLSTLIEWLPLLAPMILACSLDALITREIRAREFRLHNPELFGLYLMLSCLLTGIGVISLVLPITLPPWLIPTLVCVAGWLLAQALSHVHRRA